MTDEAPRLSDDPAQSYRDLRDNLSRVLGTATVDLLICRAAREISSANPVVASLAVRCDRPDLEALERALRGCTEDEARRAFAALNAVLLLFLARLLGREIAHRLARGVLDRGGAGVGLGR